MGEIHALDTLLKKWGVYKIDGLNEWLIPYKLTGDEVETIGKHSAYGFLTKEAETGWHVKFEPQKEPSEQAKTSFLGIEQDETPTA